VAGAVAGCAPAGRVHRSIANAMRIVRRCIG
jgi:hypothetical protein